MDLDKIAAELNKKIAKLTTTLTGQQLNLSWYGRPLCMPHVPYSEE